MTTAFPSSGSEFARLIGTPWARGRQGPEAFDCWAFAGMVQARFFGRPLPAIAGFGAARDADAGSAGGDKAAAMALARARRCWRLAERPRHGDMVEMLRHGRADHVGVWLDVDRGGVLHCQRGAGGVFDTPDRLRLMGWRPRFWTPGRTAPSAPVAGDAVPAGIYVATIGSLLDLDELAASAETAIAAHRGIPLDVRAGDTVAAVLRRAAIDPARTLCFVRKRGAPAPAPIGEHEPLDDVLDRLGRVPPGEIAGRCLRPDDILIVQHLPEGGGGGSNPLQIILQVVILVAAVAAVAFLAPAGGALAGFLGTGLGIGADAAASLAGSLVFGAVSLAGGLLVNALLPPPGPPGQRTGLVNEASPTYSAQAQGAQARPGAVIPECFGRHLHLVDYAGPPWSRFEGNVQVLYQLTCLGAGTHDVEEIRIGDVVVWREGVFTDTLPGISIELVEPHEPVTLFEDAVYTARDVTGQRLEPAEAVGFHAVVPPGIEVEAVEIDIGFSQLVRFDETTGDDLATTVDILVEAQAIDDEGAGVGDPFELETLSFTDATRSALRSSHRWFLPSGRYQLRVTRTTAEGDSNTFDDAQWIGLKGILPSGRTYGDVHLLAVAVEVGAELAAQTARRISVVKTRKLPLWDGAAWTAPQPTRAIAWAIAEIARQHGRLEHIDIDELAALDATWTARGDTLDVVADQELSLWDALQGAARAGRARPDQIGNRIRFWRDEPRELPLQLFTERNIVRGSLVQRPVLATGTTPGRLVADYMDEETWARRELAVGDPLARERRERYFGIANGDQLLREINHDFRAARYRRLPVAFTAELEGRLLMRGDPIAVAHRQLVHARSVAISRWASETVEVDAELDWDALLPDPVLVVVAPNGRVWGPIRVLRPTDDVPARSIVVSRVDLDAVIAAGHGDPRAWVAEPGARSEPLRAAIGPSALIWMRLLVESVGPERNGQATITAVDDDPRAHEDDAPATAAGVPVITALSAERRVDGADVYADAVVAVAPAVPAESILFEHSEDGGVTWQLVLESAELVAAVPVAAGTTHIRAAAVARYRGAWVEASLAEGAVAAPAAPVESVPGAYASAARIGLATPAALGAASYRWLLLPGGELPAAAIRTTVQPALSLSRQQLVGYGGPWRALTVECRAVDAAGARSDPASIALANPAPTPPSGLSVTGSNLTWNAAPEADVYRWLVNPSWTTASYTTAREVPVPPTSSSWSVTVKAVDRVGAGPGTTYVNTPPPEPEDHGR